jgi:hypothetical protein
MRFHNGQTARRRLHGGLWAAVGLTAFLGGCCKPQHAAIVPPDDPALAASLGLKRVADILGDDDTSGKLRDSFRSIAASGGGDTPIAGLGESLNHIIDRSTFKQHGLYADFDVVNPETIGHVAEFLNGPTSPLQGWKGWRYRSGVIDPKHANEAKLELRRSAPRGSKTTDSRSLYVIIFDQTPLVVK